MSDIILGGQDGLVNVLGIVLGIGTAASASGETRLILAAALAATFAESFSMAAVAYTSTKAEGEYQTRLYQEAVKNHPDTEPPAPFNASEALMSSVIVGISAIVGSLIPLLPFFWLSIKTSLIVSLIVSAGSLFVLGAYKAHVTVGSRRRSGFELAVIGMFAALVGYLVGLYFRINP